jgi:hypothetical protein
MAQEAVALVKEAPPEHSFKLHKTSIEIRSIPELAEALEIMSDESFAHHVNEQKNDFATWVGDVIHDTELSNRLKGVNTKAAAYEIVKKRAKEIGGQQYTYQSTLFGFNLWDVIIGFIGGLIIGMFLGHFLIPPL